MLHNSILTANHQTIAALESPNAATCSAVHIVDTFRFEFSCSSNIIMIIRIATVYDHVTWSKVRDNSFQCCIHRGSGHHQPDSAGRGKLADQVRLAALFSSPSTILRVPLFLAALLLVRGVPALLYRPLVGSRRSVVAGLLQATSLSFIVAASQIGLELGLITKATGAALIAAGLLSVLIFPIIALTLLRRRETRSAAVKEHA